MSLEGKVALVTGAGRGMGRATALALANDGANVAVTDILADAVEETSTDVRATGRNSVAIAADIGDGGDIDRVIADAVSALGRVDILVNNAGVTRYLDIMDITEEDWDRIHRVNARGAFFVMQRTARQMIDQGGGGRIVNIASVAGITGQGSCIAYCASKAGVISLTKSLARALGPDILVNAVAPALTETRWLDGVERAPEMRENFRKASALNRMGTAEDVAEVTLSMATDWSFVTGQIVVVDGGRML